MKPVVLTVGDSGSPWFGPRVFDDASMCPAKAAISLQGFGLPAGSSSEPLAKLSGGAWLAAANLLRELAQRGRTSAYATGKHPVKDLSRLAATRLRRENTSTREFAVAAVENLLDAQVTTTPCAFDHDPVFIKTPFGSGEMHAGGAFAFKGPAGAWQLWRLRTSTPRPISDVSRRWALMAAYCLASYLDHEGQEPLRAVEVFEVGAGNGLFERLGAWDRAALDTDFAVLRKGTLRDMAYDLQVRGGSHCSGCVFVGNCPAAPRIEGLLNFVPRQPTVLKVTPTDLRTYANCARRYQLLALQGLPGEQLAGEALHRGQNLDAWLDINHMRDIPCTEADVQRLLSETGDQAVAAMATHHLGICPKADPEVSALTTQTYVAALDATSRILLVGRPDAIYLRDSGVVWRETKTHATLAPRSVEQLVETDIAAALYLILLGSGASGTPDALEWEELSASGHELTTLLADDKDLVEAARAHVSAAVADLLADSTYVPRVGVGCIQCPVRGWCPDAP